MTISAGSVTYRTGDGSVPPEAVPALWSRAARPALWTPWAGAALSLEYALDSDAQAQWGRLTEALAVLAKAQRLWEITTHGYAREAGQTASLLVKRSPVLVQPARPPGTTGPLVPPGLHTPRRTLFFFPDRLYVRERGAYTAYAYPALGLEADTTQFTEEEEVPRDARIIGRKWRHADPNGGPDRRVRDNYRVAVTEYGVLTLGLAPGPLRLHVSSAAASDEFAARFRALGRPDAPPPPAQAPPPERFSLADCHRRLGLPASCTRSEAAAQYRQLVLATHPDRLHRAGPDVRAAASADLQEIVGAYKELKRLRGW